MLRANGVTAFEGYGLKMVIQPEQEQGLTIEFKQDDEKERPEAGLADLYNNPALWGGRGAPDFE